jgi:glutamine synthetase
VSSAADAFVATCDLVGHVTGRSVPAERHDALLESGLGWLPADLAMTTFGEIIPGTPFTSRGDLRLVPDAASGVEVPADGEHPALRLYLGDLRALDGEPWHCCPRTFLRRTLEDLHRQTGLRVVASFEHEFVLHGLPASLPLSLRRHRDAEPFGHDLVRLLTACGMEPETWLPEYGAQQFEITLAPSDGLVAADRAVLLRELVRDLALRRGLSASFAPLQDEAGTGSGVHVHLSFVDEHGRPVLLDGSRPGRLSEVGTRFASGLLRHAPAVMAWTAPSPVSFLRLRPNRWSAGGVFLGVADREALLRICPTASADTAGAARQYNLEYRAADATANPWLTLAVVLRAGLAGITGGDAYPEPVVWETTPRAGEVPSMPASIEEALRALESDSVAMSWFPPDLLSTHLGVKRYDDAALAPLPVAERLTRIACAY